MRNEKVVKTVVSSFMVISFFGIIYSLGFFTDFLPIRSAYKDLYNELQVFNRGVFNYAFLALIPIVLMFIMDNHKSNQYGLVNKVVGVIAGFFALYQSYFVLSQLGGLKSGYGLIDVTKVQLLYPNYKMSTMAFTFGYIIYALLAIAAVLVILVTLVNKKNKEVVKEG